MPFSGKTLDFLVENRFRDSREWYREHKEEFQKQVMAPMLELSEQLGPVMKELDPLLVTEARRTVSRVYRDTRYTKDKSLFREVMWVAFVRDKNGFPSAPGMVFEFSPRGWRYGCGWWQAPTKTMESLRQLVLAGDRDWKKAHRAWESCGDRFAFEGECYKRPHWPSRPQEERLWLERRNIDFMCNSTDFDLLFSSRLHLTLAAGFRELAPVYHFLCKADSLACRE